MALVKMKVAAAAYTFEVGDEKNRQTRVAVTGNVIEVDDADGRVAKAIESGWLVKPDAEVDAPADVSLPDGEAAAMPDISSPVTVLSDWVGDDKVRAGQVLDAEHARPEDEQRSTLIAKLESIVNG